MIDLMRPVWVEVDLEALRDNYKVIKAFVGDTVKVGAVLKADAYGHGAVEVARALIEQRVDYLCVAGLNEALELRRCYEDIPILVMGYTPENYYGLAVKKAITLTMFDIVSAELLDKTCRHLNTTGKVHIKLDTGFNRIGFKLEQMDFQDMDKILNMKGLEIEGIFSHLALVDTRHDESQFDHFMNVVTRLEESNRPIGLKHICDSNAAALYPQMHLDMVRVGASLYGYNNETAEMSLRPVLEFKTKIVHLKIIHEGEGVGYNHEYVADGDRKIATLPCGYGDGIPRSLSNRGFVYIADRKAPIVGKICMDQMMVDVTELDVKLGDTVRFYGREAEALTEMARIADTNKNEILAGISRRVPRVYLEGHRVIRRLDYMEGML